MTNEEKGEWAEVADAGIAPVADDDAALTGRTVGGDEPATDDGIDRTAGDNADAVRDGGQNRPDGDQEPDLRDAAAGPRQVDVDAAHS
ncbi:MAG TPA: hypothetical protein VFM58_24865 [Solirubrobacteraceae bacterium]|nr:hypothetical protein [Solirubrobacteraceae bacterium]